MWLTLASQCRAARLPAAAGEPAKNGGVPRSVTETAHLERINCASGIASRLLARYTGHVFDLRLSTPRAWLDHVFADFDAFLLDHTLCERKASATGMSLVAKYPDKTLIGDDLIEFAREELEHFHIMYRICRSRGLILPEDEKDLYVNRLRALVNGRHDEELFLDRLLIPGVVEARGCERLMLVSEALEESPLKQTYLEVTRAEARHHALFFRLARRYFDESVVQRRADQLLDAEAEIMASLPLRARVH